MPIRVTAKPGEDPEKLISRFKRIVNKEGILKEVKQRKFYEKPSSIRRREEKERRKAIHRAQRKKYNVRKEETSETDRRTRREPRSRDETA